MEELEEGQEPDFPHTELAKLDEMINRPRWVVPVLPKGELEVLLDASIDLCKRSKYGETFKSRWHESLEKLNQLPTTLTMVIGRKITRSK